MRRWIVRIFVFLLLGAIVNVAVAWGLSNIVYPWFATLQSRHGFVRLSDKSTYVTTGPGHIKLIQYWQPIGVAGASAIMPLSDDQFRSQIPSWSAFLQSDPALREPATLEPGEIAWFNEIACGWPMYCVRGAATCIASGAQNTTVTVDSLWSAGKREYWLPRRPIWPGFAINTVFYAAILWLLFAAPFALRRRRRVRKGLCPNCGYPIGTSAVCTECGERMVHGWRSRRLK